MSVDSEWPIVPLGPLAALISSGVTPKGGAEVYLSSGPVMLIRSQNVQMNRLSLDDVAFITDEIDNSMSRSRVTYGDVLLNITGASIGRVTTFDLHDTRADVNQHVCVIRPKPDVLFHRYLSYLILSPSFQLEIERLQHGGTRQALTFSLIAGFKIPFPPLTEQRRIAAILDQAEALRTKRRHALAQLDTLTQSLFLNLFGDPVANQKGWRRTPFAELLTGIDSGWSPTCLDRPVVGYEWGVLKLGAVTWCDYNPAENKALPPHMEPDPNLEIKPGDLLFTLKNTYELVAACALVRETPPRLLMSDLIFRLRLRPDVPLDSCFLHQLLINPTKRREIQKLAGGSAGSMPNISKGRLQAALIEVPPLPLQHEFAAQVSAVERLKASQRASLAKLDALFASLQHRAFRGGSVSVAFIMPAVRYAIVDSLSGTRQELDCHHL